MSGNQDNSFSSFNRRPNEDRDSMSSMRERMDRDREAFFADRPTQGRQWPPFFQNAPTFDRNFPEADSLASAFRSPRFGMGNFPGEAETADNMQNPNVRNPRSNYQQYRNSSDADKHFTDNDKSNNTSTHPTSSNNADSIPIRVAYSNPKNKYTSDGRNTTELPVRGSSNFENTITDSPGGSSPRLERSHSEPPKTFTQKLRAAGATPVGGWVVPGTIPENAESLDGESPRINTKTPHVQHYNLSAPHNNLSTSASAPSVPSHQNRPSTAPPVAPPRRSVPSRVNMNNERQTEEETPAVRHIPIFVEGRDEPVFNKRLSNSELNQKKMSDGTGRDGGLCRDNENSGIRKPSDFYPTGVKKVTRGSTNPPHLDVNQRIPQEPTSPISPPPGPIPMGYDPQGNFGPPKEEPTSPQPPPPGPIPMTCSPNFLQQPGKPDKTIEENSSPAQHTSKDVTDAPASHRSSNTHTGESDKHASRKTSTESGTGEGVHIVPISVQEEEETNSTTVPSCEKGDEEMPIDPAMEKLQKVKHEVAELVEKIESFNGSKDNKEYRYLDEMLTRHMLSLDSIEAAGRDDIRQIRKDTIRSINRCLSTLDARASGKPGNFNNKDADDNNAIIDELAAKSNTEEK